MKAVCHMQRARGHAYRPWDTVSFVLVATGTLPYIGEAICLPSGEHEKNGYHAYHGYQVIQN